MGTRPNYTFRQRAAVELTAEFIARTHALDFFRTPRHRRDVKSRATAGLKIISKIAVGLSKQTSFNRLVGRLII